MLETIIHGHKPSSTSLQTSNRDRERVENKVDKERVDAALPKLTVWFLKCSQVYDMVRVPGVNRF